MMMAGGVRHDDLRRRNRALLIAAVRRAGSASRTALVGITGLSHSTISTISATLLAEGVLAGPREATRLANRRGRPQVAIRLNGDVASVVTVSLLYNLLDAALVDYAGRTLAEDSRKIATEALDAPALLAEIEGIVARLIGKAGTPASRVLRIVVAIQGTTDAAGRTLLWSPITPHEGLEIADHLEAAFSVPVRVENDCNMIAVGLRWKMPDRYRQDFIAVLLSRGIGMGLVLKGDLFIGTHSSGGEFGHMVHRPGGALCRCGRRGCIEAYAGNYAILRRARGEPEDRAAEADLDAAEMRAIAAAARAHDGPEREAFRKAGEALGYGLGNLFALIDPAPVAMVGMGAAAFDLIEPSLRAAIAETAGGQHSHSITLATEADEMPFLRLGCAMRGLTAVDDEVMAPSLAQGRATPAPEPAGAATPAG